MGQGTERLTDPRWLVVTLKRGRELDAQREIDNNGFRAFVPYYMKRIRSGRQWIKAARPLFGPYGFAETHEDEWQGLISLRDICRPICWPDGEPQWVPDECMSELLNAFGAGPVEFDEEIRPRFKEGVPIDRDWETVGAE